MNDLRKDRFGQHGAIVCKRSTHTAYMQTIQIYSHCDRKRHTAKTIKINEHCDLLLLKLSNLFRWILT